MKYLPLLLAFIIAAQAHADPTWTLRTYPGVDHPASTTMGTRVVFKCVYFQPVALEGVTYNPAWFPPSGASYTPLTSSPWDGKIWHVVPAGSPVSGSAAEAYAPLYYGDFLAGTVGNWGFCGAFGGSAVTLPFPFVIYPPGVAFHYAYSLHGSDPPLVFEAQYANITPYSDGTLSDSYHWPFYQFNSVAASAPPPTPGTIINVSDGAAEVGMVVWSGSQFGAYVEVSGSTYSVYIDGDLYRWFSGYGSIPICGFPESTDGDGPVHRTLWLQYELSSTSSPFAGTGGLDTDCCAEITARLDTISGTLSNWREAWNSQDTWFRSTASGTLLYKLEQIRAAVSGSTLSGARTDPDNPDHPSGSQYATAVADPLSSATVSPFSIGITDVSTAPVWSFTTPSITIGGQTFAGGDYSVDFSSFNSFIVVIRYALLMPVILWGMSWVWNEFRRY